MRLSTITGFLAFALPALAQDYNQSAPFNLVLISKNETYNNAALGACHTGAAIESLCLGGKLLAANASFTTFQFNTTANQVVENPNAGVTGQITYLLRGGNFNESEPFTLVYDATSNVAIPVFEPAYSGTYVAFDKRGLLNIQGYVNDTVYPPNTSKFTPYYRWYACHTYFTGYQYITLAWVVGPNKPENPTCVKVDVKRLFI